MIYCDAEHKKKVTGFIRETVEAGEPLSHVIKSLIMLSIFHVFSSLTLSY